MKVVWTRRAGANLDAIRDYIATDDPTAAMRTATRIVDASDRLGDHPAMGRPGRVPGTRELVVPGTHYIVPYRIRDERVEILRVLHAARKWPSGFL